MLLASSAGDRFSRSPGLWRGDLILFFCLDIDSDGIKNHDFNDLVRLEQLRHIETGQPQALSYAGIASMEAYPASGFSYAAFLERLLDRAHHLVHDNHLDEVLQQPEKLFIRASRIILLLAAVLGGLAAVNAASESSTLNIYWLLVVLLGFNFLSMLLWCAGILLSVQGLSSGIAAQLACWLPFSSRKRVTPLVRLLHVPGGNLPVRQGGPVANQHVDSSVLAGLSACRDGRADSADAGKTVRFRLGTTLLPENSLPELTRLLGVPMQHIGLAVPDGQQIAASRIGAGVQDSVIRSAWAEFLVGALIVYGLLPRLILMLLAFSC